MKVGDVICVADFHDLCPQQVRYFVGNLSRTLSQSRRNGTWALFSPLLILVMSTQALKPNLNTNLLYKTIRPITHECTFIIYSNQSKIDSILALE